MVSPLVARASLILTRAQPSTLAIYRGPWLKRSSKDIPPHAPCSMSPAIRHLLRGCRLRLQTRALGGGGGDRSGGYENATAARTFASEFHGKKGDGHGVTALVRHLATGKPFAAVGSRAPFSTAAHKKQGGARASDVPSEDSKEGKRGGTDDGEGRREAAGAAESSEGQEVPAPGTAGAAAEDAAKAAKV